VFKRDIMDHIIIIIVVLITLKRMSMIVQFKATTRQLSLIQSIIIHTTVVVYPTMRKKNMAKLYKTIMR